MKIDNNITTQSFGAKYANEALMRSIDSYAQKLQCYPHYVKAIKRINSIAPKSIIDIQVFADVEGRPSVTLSVYEAKNAEKMLHKNKSMAQNIYNSYKEMHPYRYAVNVIIKFSKTKLKEAVSALNN